MMTRTDRQGNPMSGATPEAADFFDAAVGAFNVYRGDPVALLDRAIAAAPGFAMSHILKAHLFALATEPDATREAKGILMQVGALNLNKREASHAGALQMVIEGRWTDAAVALEKHSVRWPRDLVALQSGHLMDFYRASARSLRDPDRAGAAGVDAGDAGPPGPARHARLRSGGDRRLRAR